MVLRPGIEFVIREESEDSRMKTRGSTVRVVTARESHCDSTGVGNLEWSLQWKKGGGPENGSSGGNPPGRASRGMFQRGLREYVARHCPPLLKRPPCESRHPAKDRKLILSSWMISCSTPNIVVEFVDNAHIFLFFPDLRNRRNAGLFAKNKRIFGIAGILQKRRHTLLTFICPAVKTGGNKAILSGCLVTRGDHCNAVRCTESVGAGRSAPQKQPYSTH